MTREPYQALLLDLDGTLLDERGAIHPTNRAAVHAAAARGVRVMIATGRSVASALPVVEELGLDSVAVVFNGAAVWCPKKRRLIEERVLSNRTLERALRFGAERDLATVLMCADKKLGTHPRDALERAAMSGLHGLELRPRAELEAEYVIRVTYFSSQHADSAALAVEVERALAQPVYITHFPLNALAYHRESPLSVVDLHPPCRGKGESLRVLQELYGIAPERVVAVGDATNDIPMFELAGLSVAMGDGMPEAVAAATRVIDGHRGTALADLVDELFLSSAPEALEG